MISIQGSRFVDENGRTLILRGVNLGGSSKVPKIPNGATHIQSNFFDHTRVSFVGRPFPLGEADEHFSRLANWGLTFIRFLVTWEAIEHVGPGIYDQEYLDYLDAVIRKAGEYGLYVFIDPHQDVWSRFSGGDGAPGWTFEAAGLNITKFKDTGAAIVHQTHGEPFPQMIWPTNMVKLAAATMFTLFFAGDDFAPKLKIDGESIQSYLQRHYIDAICQIAKRLHDCPNVIGYDTMNEPLSGYIGWADLNQPGGPLSLGQNPSPFQSFQLASGIPLVLDIWRQRPTGTKVIGNELVNPNKQHAWLDDRECIWRQHGVWDIGSDGTPLLLRPDYFYRIGDRQVDFNQDYLLPFINRYARKIRESDPDALIFVETEPNHPAPIWSDSDALRIVYAPHWYDAYVLFMKSFSPYIAYDTRKDKIVLGRKRIQKSFTEQLFAKLLESKQKLGDVPVLIGEIGIPFDMHAKKAYHTGDFSKQIQALDRSMRAVERNMMNITLWNYTADNDNEHGDQWNDEDLSIFSRDQQVDPEDIHSGGRALRAVIRPYATAISGEPTTMSFDIKRRIFTFKYRHDPRSSLPTEIYVPNFQYPNGYEVSVSDGTVTHDHDNQRILYTPSSDNEEHTIRVNPPRHVRGVDH